MLDLLIVTVGFFVFVPAVYVGLLLLYAPLALLVGGAEALIRALRR